MLARLVEKDSTYLREVIGDEDEDGEDGDNENDDDGDENDGMCRDVRDLYSSMSISILQSFCTVATCRAAYDDVIHV